MLLISTTNSSLNVAKILKSSGKHLLGKCTYNVEMERFL